MGPVATVWFCRERPVAGDGALQWIGAKSVIRRILRTDILLSVIVLFFQEMFPKAKSTD